jgi:hypothetical protein
MSNIKEAVANMLRRPSASAGMADDLIVCLEPHSEEPVTSAERFAIAVLKAKGPQPFHRLVECVASELYREELRNGATTLDIGLFGSKLFVPDVVGELKARNGSLWRIGKAEEFNREHAS